MYVLSTSTVICRKIGPKGGVVKRGWPVVTAPATCVEKGLST